MHEGSKMLRNFLVDESGATAIEYGLIVSMIFLAILVAVNQFASETKNMYNGIGAAVNGVMP